MRFFRTGFSTSSKHLLQLVFFLVINRLLMEKSGESGVAVFDIVYNVSFFTTYLYEGISEAAQPLCKHVYGRKQRIRLQIRTASFKNLGAYTRAFL